VTPSEAGPLELLRDGPAAGPTIALAPGAGAGMRSPFLDAITAHLVEAGLRVARFEFPYMRRAAAAGARIGRPDPERLLRAAWLEAIEALGGPERLVIGGKSMGGRIASMVADEAGVRGLVCLGYPFHPPGRPDRLRTAHLEALATPALIVQGERDPFGAHADVEGYRLAPTIALRWLEDGDHSFKPRKASGHTLAEHLRTAAEATAAFVKRLDRAAT
jgi:predicted alpha/beta-hydrolase family hydrolase